MKHLMTLVALLVSTAAVAQIPTLPWNPDGNDDQFIGLPDLLDLLTVYGQEFENAIVAEDGESAIMYMGDMGLIQCGYACDNLPGFWTLPTLFDLAPVLSDIGNANAHLKFDLNAERNLTNQSRYYYPYYDGSDSFARLTFGLGQNFQCYCTAKQLPRVEYDYCLTSNSASNTPGTSVHAASFKACCNAKVQEGWYPIGAISIGAGEEAGQAFWRFAQ